MSHPPINPLRPLKKPIVAALELVPEGTAPGIVLILAAAAALIVANSPLAHGYETLLATELGPLTLHHWINDGLMALFFFQVGLEVKREVLEGDLSTAEARRMPVIAAVAGMAVPALVYLAVTRIDPQYAHGWAVSSATDIAFALGVLTLLGDRVPGSLKLLLATIAIADDIGAVLIIAFGYTESLAWGWLAAAAAIVAVLALINRRGVLAMLPYAVLAALLWVAVLRSGVHATVAGVLAALCVPIGPGEVRGPLEKAEHALAPWVSYLVLPVFGFANAGLALGGVPILAPLPLAVMLGLFAGKQLGVFGALRGLAAMGLAHPPEGASWSQLYGLSLLTGIGFTMSLFIASLAFPDAVLVEEAKAGVLGGSLLSAVAGAAVLLLASRRRSEA